MFHTARRRRTRGAPHFLTWLAMAMFLVSLTPAATYASAGRPSPKAVETAQDTQYLEIHVASCPPGTDPDSAGLYNLCHDNGIADVDVTVTGPGVDQTISTTQESGVGPGKARFDGVVAGDYVVELGIPGDLSAFSVYCSDADSDARVTANPDDTKTSTVTVPDGLSVVCDFYVIPQGGTGTGATLDFTVTTCDRADMPSDTRTFADLSANCTDKPTQPITLTLGQTGQPDVTETTTTGDKGNELVFNNLPNGDYTVYSNVPFDEGADYLFCEYTGQDRYPKDFNADGVTTFTNMAGENIECDWFVVYAAPQDDSGNPPPVTPDEPEPGEASISLDVLTCPADYDVAANGENGAAFAANCTTPTDNVLMTLAGTTGAPVEIPTAADGTVVFSDLAPDTYTLTSGVPLEFATEYLFCMAGDDVEYQKDFDDMGVTTFQDVDTEQLDCAWYIVPESQRGDETGATVTVHLAACPEGYAGDTIYKDCHGNGIADMDFTLTGPNGESTATTTIPATPGPGVATFTKLPAGEYTLAGGPPQDFGKVKLFCTDPATGESVDAPLNGGIASLSLADQQSILCDWYFIPESAIGTETPVPAPKKAEILVTLFACDEGTATAGATFSQLDSACDTPVNDINVSLGVPGGTPIAAATGASGEGAVRFYDLRPGDYVMTPDLPSTYTSAAVYCQIGDGDVYQKTFQNGSTTFVNLEGEQIACSWFLARVPKQPEKPVGPTGSITVRQFLCAKDRGEIKDWERECTPGSSGSAFSLTSSDGAVVRNATPNDQGVLVFGELPDGYYDLTQDTGVWCKAAAERVDSRSRVIVQDGGNTDVFLYECNQVVTLPTTGSGPIADTGAWTDASLLLATLAVPIFGAAVWQALRTRPEPVPVRVERATPSRTKGSGLRMRFH
ncbi:MAG TPA: hypothetical protein VNZ58_02670 [Thermomicrobiales bacterium]|nr:hypothetical protein [Thermomicrobiales bacterium]